VIPVIAAPMTGVSGPDLVGAAIDAGIGGSFPAHNAGDSVQFDEWLVALGGRGAPGPLIPNLIVHRSSTRLDNDLEVIVRHRVPAVITSVGSPADVVGPLHGSDVLVLSDVSTIHHARRAIDAGVDGLVLLAAGAGGQTGWANPLAFLRSVRSEWDGLIVLAGGVVDGASILGALAAGADLVAMGTAFIATNESAGGIEYAEAIVAAAMDDIEIRTDLTGLPTNMIRTAAEPGSVRDPNQPYDAAVLESGRGSASPARIFSAGHGAGAIDSVQSVAALVDRLGAELDAARRGRSLRRLG
jgi:nitronate monooxygenase